MDNNRITKRIDCSLFKYFWLIGVLPKAIQFVILSLLLVKLYKRNIGKLFSQNITGLFFIAGLVIQIIAIVYQILFAHPEIPRVLAAFNTVLIWFISLGFYKYYSENQIRQSELSLISRYIVIDFFILFLLYVFSLFYNGNTISIAGYTLPLRHLDYLEGVRSYRFSGLLETQLATAHMFLIFLPILLVSNGSKKEERVKLIAVVAAFVAVMNGHSRVGILACLVSVLAYFWRYLVSTKLTKNSRISLFLIVSIVALFFLFRNLQEVFGIFVRVFNGRLGSNSARMIIYRESIKKVLHENPLFGVGIKYMIHFSWFDIPYGSHSTYIGILFKAGLVGSVFFLLGFMSLFRRILASRKKDRVFYCVLASVLSYFLFLCLADLDGINWACVSAFSMWGILSNKTMPIDG